MKTNLNNLSTTELSELRELMFDISNRIEDYCHVSHKLSKSLLNAIKAEHRLIEKEIEVRNL